MDAVLEFNVSNQIITRVDDFDVVADSHNYLYAHFNFLTDEWNNNGTPTAIFTNDGETYNQILDGTNTCLVPHETLESDDKYILVSVFCGDRITANTASVFVIESGWNDDMEASTPPTPSVYAQIIARMNGIEDAVEDATERAEDAATKADEAVSHYPRIIDEYWYVWDVENEEFVNTGIRAEGDDGTSATVQIEAIPSGHRVIITDANGEHSFDVPDGYDGRGIVSVAKTGTEGDVDIYTMSFTSGDPFIYYVTNGTSSTITSYDIANGHRLIITDKNGTHTVDVMNGSKGDTGVGIHSIAKSASYQNIDYYTITYTNGSKTTFSVTNAISPTLEVTEYAGGHTITINDINGTQSFNVPDGNVGTLPVHICDSSEYDHTTGVPTIQNPVEDAFYLVPSDDPKTSDMFREWIYTDNHWEVFGGAKVDLSEYVKYTDYATTGKGGVVKVSSTNGLFMDSSTGNIRISPASTTTIKTGTNTYQPIVPNYQHASTFYGLAKAAGDTTQASSSNAVGTYTTNAKSQIAQMLDVAKRSTIASEYQSVTYDVGDYVIRLGSLYRCTTAITTPESWNSSHWTLVTVGSELENLGITVDSTMSDSSTNPVQNKVIKKALDDMIVVSQTMPSGNNDLWFESTGSLVEIPTMSDLDNKIEDVQVNGSSVVTDGVANVPMADSNTIGVMKVGNGLEYNSSANEVRFRGASLDEIKAGNQAWRVLTPYRENAATFYGLAKAAGDTTQAQSSNAVGTYTDSAKSSIRSMLGALSAKKVNVTLNVSDWSNDGSCTKSVSGVTTTNVVIVSYDPMYKDDYTAADIYCASQNNGSLTFVCATPPTVQIIANVLIIDGVS